MLESHKITTLLLDFFPGQEALPSFWDSLKHLEIITGLEEKLHCKFSLQEIIETHNNIELFIKTIQEKSCP